MKRVLIIDDEPLIRLMVKKDLEKLGYQIDTASNGEEGWQKIINQPPDLVITDLNMPGVYGLELLERIRNEPTTAELPVLCITSDSNIDTKQRAILMKATGWVQKPFNSESWRGALKQILG
jgi:two-component system chemotaxis response regulator CheY